VLAFIPAATFNEIYPAAERMTITSPMFEVLLEVIASCFPIISKTDPRPTADVFAHNEIAIHAD
jgi:hypothetical protein